jgi:hypothetical protein
MFSYICLFFSILFVILLLGVIIYYLDNFRFFKIVTNFEQYATVLEYYMQKAYEIIYKDRILIYSLEALKINDIDFNIVSKDFALLTFKLMGPNLKDEFVNLYGNEETLIFNLMEYFNRKFEDDEIRKKAEDNLVNNEENNLLL